MKNSLLMVMGVFLMVGFANAAEYRPNEVIVKYKDQVARTRVSMNALYESLGVRNVTHRLGSLKNMDRLFLNENIKVQDVIERLSHESSVEYAQPNYIVRTLPVHDWTQAELAKMEPLNECPIPGLDLPSGCGSHFNPANRPELQPAPADVIPAVDDPQLSMSYGMTTIGATQAWSITRGSRDIIVADIDTGADYNHEDLAFNMWRNPNPSSANDLVGYDFIHKDGLPYDDNEHGTHTAGTIGAVGGNGLGTSGVSQRVSLMAVKFLDGDGKGDIATAIQAIDYAVAHGARILSNSWGGPAGDTNQALSDAISQAGQKGVLFVAAAGNDSADDDSTYHQSFPAAFKLDNMLSVAATDSNDRLASFSDIGATTIHVAAPGVNVYSTFPNNKYKNMSGTSMACPHVAGAAALVWSKNPNWTYLQVKKALMDTVDPLDSLQGKTVTGGRINVFKALSATE